MKITGSDIREFFKEHDYTGRDMREGDLAPYQLADHINTINEDGRFLIKVDILQIKFVMDELIKTLNSQPLESSRISKRLSESADKLQELSNKLN